MDLVWRVFWVFFAIGFLSGIVRYLLTIDPPERIDEPQLLPPPKGTPKLTVIEGGRNSRIHPGHGPGDTGQRHY